MNLNGPYCKASKNISNDTKLEAIPREPDVKNPFFNFCVGVWVRGHDGTNFSHISKDAQENFTSFDTIVVPGGGWGNMFFNEKPTKNRKLRGFKLRGLRQNQINTPNIICLNDQRNKINALSDF